jgi:hypothetical protein
MADSDRHNHNTADQPRGPSSNDRIIHVDGELTEEANEPTYGQRLADGFAWRGRDE